MFTNWQKMRSIVMKDDKIKLVIIISSVISLSIASHLICYSLFNFLGMLIIPSSFTYMLVLALMNLLAVTYSRGVVLITIIMEGISNFLILIIINIVLKILALTNSANATQLDKVIFLYGNMFTANIIGSTFAYIANFIIFNYLYTKFNYFTSGFFTTLVLILIYTPLTDSIAFGQLFPLHIKEIITTNIFSNMVFFSFWSLLISMYLTKKESYD